MPLAFGVHAAQYAQHTSHALDLTSVAMVHIIQQLFILVLLQIVPSTTHSTQRMSLAVRLTKQSAGRKHHNGTSPSHGSCRAGLAYSARQ
jgi:hypothetical protein